MIGIAEQFMLYMHGVLGTAVAGIIFMVIYAVYGLLKGTPSLSDPIEPQHNID